MDYRKYYKLDHGGTYTLHFSNVNRLSSDEIKEIFSQFGEVLSVNETASETGYRFVRYRTLEEVKNCLDGLKNNNEISILPERKDCPNKRMDKSSSQKQTVDNTDQQSNGNFMYNKKFSEPRFQKERSTYNTRTSNYGNRTDDTDSFLDTGSHRTNKSNINEIKASDKQDVLISKEKHSLPQRKNFIGNSSSDRTSYDKYYKKLKDGSYMIHFANKKKFSEEEITNIFSEYGTILSIVAGGDDNGLRFVRYKNLNDIISCMNGLQNKNLINILPQKAKIIQADQRELNQRQITLEDSPQKMLDGKQANSTSTFDETFLETTGKQIHDTNNIKTSDWNNRSTNSSDIDSQSSKHNYKPTVNTTRCEKLGLLVKTKSHFSKTDGNTHINKNMSDDNRTSMLDFDTEIMQKESVCSLQPKDASSKVKVIPLQEIIVANIHTDYDIHYILHLFKKYDPIAVTFINVISENNIRYCRVYFKTVQEAVAVEEEFDNYVLSGKNLIVLRESKVTGKS